MAVNKKNERGRSVSLLMLSLTLSPHFFACASESKISTESQVAVEASEVAVEQPAVPPVVSTKGEVVISEFLAVNNALTFDEAGDDPDWLEVVNVSAAAVNLSGWYLTDKADNLTKWAFPEVVLNPGEYLLVFASNKDIVEPNGTMHTNFKLNSSGDYLAVVKPDGTTISHAYSPTYPPQQQNISYGVEVETLKTGYFLTPTPGTANTAVVAKVGVEPSQASGFFSQPFDLELSAELADLVIRYTTDGSIPTATTGALYQQPIAITTTTIVRAASFLNGQPVLGGTVTTSYIFPAHMSQQTHQGVIDQGFPVEWVEQDGSDWTLGGTREGASYGLDTEVTQNYTTDELVESLESLPWFSIVMPIDDWFGYNTPSGVLGIYANSEESDPFWTRQASVEYIDANGGEGFKIDAGVEIQGDTSTAKQYRNQLSFRIEFKQKFGPKVLNFPLFQSNGIYQAPYATINDSIILDGGTQNSIHAFPPLSAQGLRDQFIADMQRALGEGGNTFYGHHVHVIINGIYWGTYNVHDTPNRQWVARTYNVKKDDVDDIAYIKEGTGFDKDGNPFNAQNTPGPWATACNIANLGVGANDTYEGQDAMEALAEYLDLSEYVAYLLLNFYAENEDWPQRNWMATRIPGQKFRFHSWDAEMVMPLHAFRDPTELESSLCENAVFFHTKLKENPEYLILFADLAHKFLFNGGPLYVDPEYATAGTAYDPGHPERNRPASLYFALATRFEKAMIMEYARWGNYFHAPGTYTPATWKAERDRLLNDYFPTRSQEFLGQLKNSGLYPELVAPTFNQHGGQVANGFSLTVQAPVGASVYLTTNGEDPRLKGGAINASAILYQQPISLSADTTVKVRSFNVDKNGDNVWSALNAATFTIAAP